MNDSLPLNVANARPLGKLYLRRSVYQKFVLKNCSRRTKAPTVALSNVAAQFRSNTLQKYFCVLFHGLLSVLKINADTSNKEKVLSIGHRYKLWMKYLTFAHSSLLHYLYL